MKKAILILVSMLVVFVLQAQDNYMEQWAQFRGPFASGIVDSTNIPERWDVTSGRNIIWKTEIPGLGHSSPIIWDDKVFVTTAVPDSGVSNFKPGLYGSISNIDTEPVQEYRVLCIDKNSGEILWDELSHKGVPKTKRHIKSSHANPTPATNGKYVVAFFGSEGLYCYDFTGKQIWKKEFEKMKTGYFMAPSHEWGISSSPIIHDETVIIQCDLLDSAGFIATYDVRTGNEKWKVVRKELPTWSTPNVYELKGKKIIVVNGYNHIGGYDFETGEEIWKMRGGGDVPVPTPFFAHQMIYIHNAHGGQSPIYAIKMSAKGDITLAPDSLSGEFVAWRWKRGGAYNPTSLVYDNFYYGQNMNGSLKCINAINGDLLYNEKLPDSKGVTSSVVASDDKFYVCAENGFVYVLKTGDKMELIAKNKMKDAIMATPAISKDKFIIRTQHYLFAIGEE